VTTFASDDFREIDEHGPKGAGLFASRRFAAGDAIYRLDYWTLDRMPMHATNHSCDPNGRFDEDGLLVATRAIEVDEEITFDYLSTPLPASPWNFRCECGSSACVGWLRAA